MLQPWLRIGVAVKAQGIKGEVKVLPLTDDARRFEGLKEVHLETSGGYEGRRIEGLRIAPQGDVVFLKLEGVGDRAAAEGLRGVYLCVNRAQAVALPPDSYFICDLVGCRVEDIQGNELGQLTEVLQPGAQDIYVVRGRREWLIPAVAAFILSVDIPNRRIVVDAQALEEEEV